MLRPDKHMNLDFSILNVAAFILSQFKRREEVGYDELAELLTDSMNNNAVSNYPYALNFLFLLDKINYNPDNDSFTINETE